VWAEHSSDCVVSKIVEETFGADGTFTIASGNFSVSLND
jgi:hypothetical protein